MQFPTTSSRKRVFDFDTASVTESADTDAESHTTALLSVPTEAELAELDAICMKNVIHNVGRVGR